MEPSARPIIIVKKRAGYDGHHGGAWKVAYADFVTAMMALFIVLWLMNANKPVQEAIGGYFRDPSGTSDKKGTSLTGTGASPGTGPGESFPLTKDNMPKLKEEFQNAVQQLKGFEKVSLNPGQSVRVSFPIDRRDLSYWDVKSNSWQVAPGCYVLMVAHSSRGIAQQATLPAGGASCPGTAAGGGRPALTLSVRPARASVGRRTRFRFRVTSVQGSGHHGVRGVRIRFAGRSVRTDRRGRAALVKVLHRRGVYTARAATRGSGAATARVRAIR